LQKFNHYVESCADKKKFIARFLESSNCNNILQLLKKKYVKICETKVIFQSLTHVVVNISKESSRHVDVAFNIASQMMKSCLIRIYEMLCEDRYDRINVALSFLT
ncbi:hypothetical protein SK128_007672, partial [Halocaridina rubra]